MNFQITPKIQSNEDSRWNTLNDSILFLEKHLRKIHPLDLTPSRTHKTTFWLMDALIKYNSRRSKLLNNFTHTNLSEEDYIEFDADLMEMEKIIMSYIKDKDFGESSLHGLKSDIEIWTSIKNKFIQYNSRDLFKNVSVKVIEGRVLLTGNVEKAKTKILAEKISWIPHSVHEVINEINVDEEYNIKISAKDIAITTHIKTRLALEKNIKSNNYKIETVNGIVYVIGITKSKDELSKALDLISKINGVKKVVNYVLIRPLE